MFVKTSQSATRIFYFTFHYFPEKGHEVPEVSWIGIKNIYPHHGLTAVSMIDSKYLKLPLGFFDNQMFDFFFLAHNCSRCLLMSFDLHSAADFLDGRGVVDVVDKVDHHKYLFLLLLTGLWSSSFSSNQILIFLTADPSSQ